MTTGRPKKYMTEEERLDGRRKNKKDFIEKVGRDAYNERLKGESKLYYHSHKEELREKRLLKEAENKIKK